jgi:hypothetical protein
MKKLSPGLMDGLKLIFALAVVIPAPVSHARIDDEDFRPVASPVIAVPVAAPIVAPVVVPVVVPVSAPVAVPVCSQPITNRGIAMARAAAGCGTGVPSPVAPVAPVAAPVAPVAAPVLPPPAAPISVPGLPGPRPQPPAAPITATPSAPVVVPPTESPSDDSGNKEANFNGKPTIVGEAMNYAEKLVKKAAEAGTLSFNPGWDHFVGYADGASVGSVVYFQGGLQPDGTFTINWWNSKTAIQTVHIKNHVTGATFDAKLLMAVRSAEPCGTQTAHLMFQNLRNKKGAAGWMLTILPGAKKAIPAIAIASIMLSVNKVALGDGMEVVRESYSYTPAAVFVDYGTWEAMGEDFGNFTTDVLSIIEKLSDSSYESPYSKAIKAACALIP